MIIDEAYQTYKLEPTPQNLNTVVNGLNSSISYALSNYNALGDPVIKAKAKVIAAKAIQTYDPSYGANLETHVSNQLQQLNRVVRKERSPLQLSERHQLDAYALDKAEKEYMDEFGKEPDVATLADKIGLSPKRIAKIRSNTFAAGTELIAPTGEDIAAGAEGTDHTDEAIEMVYQDSDYKDRKIMEYKLGYGGKPQIDDMQELANKLKIHPSQISRRSAKLMIKINEHLEALEAMGG